MPEAGFFVRVRGKISGPYGIEALRRMVRQGLLSRVHEISADRQSWTRAAEYEDLFPTPVPTGQRASQEPELAFAPSEPIDLAPQPQARAVPLHRPAPAPAADAGRYYYSQNGNSAGPVAMSMLKLMASNGTLGGDDLVWLENATTSLAARDMPALSAYFAGAAAAPAPSLEMWPAAEGAMQPVMTYGRRGRNVVAGQIRGFATIIGIGAGAILLFCMVAPWLSVDTPLGSKSFFSWDIFKATGEDLPPQVRTVVNAASAVVVYLIIAGVAAGVVGALTQGVARGATFAGIAGVALLLILNLVFAFDARASTNLGVAFGMFFWPASMAGLMGVCFARAASVDSPAIRAMLAAFSGVAGLSLVIGFSIYLSNGRSSAASTSNASENFAVALMFASVVCGLGATVFGFIGLRPQFVIAINRTTWILAACAITLPLFAIIVSLMGELPHSSISHESDNPIDAARLSIMGIFFRLIAIWISILAILTIGVAELPLGSRKTHAPHNG